MKKSQITARIKELQALFYDFSDANRDYAAISSELNELRIKRGDYPAATALLGK